jgi:hypothetical protein
MPDGKSIEYTLYPPHIDRDQFASANRYPIFITKFIGQPPASPNEVFNQGEAGLIERKIDYFMIDDFTYLYDDFNEPWICQHNHVECDFYKKLIANKTHYKLLKTFSYHLPPYLPQLSIAFVNPNIQIFQYDGKP